LIQPDKKSIALICMAPEIDFSRFCSLDGNHGSYKGRPPALLKLAGNTSDVQVPQFTD